MSAGLVAEVVAVAFLMLSRRDPFHGLNAGFIGLCVNSAISAVVSRFTPARQTGFDQALPDTARS